MTPGPPFLCPRTQKERPCWWPCEICPFGLRVKLFSCVKTSLCSDKLVKLLATCTKTVYKAVQYFKLIILCMISIWEWLRRLFGNNFICVHFRSMWNPLAFSVSMQIYCNFWKRLRKPTCQKTQLTMLGFVASVLTVLCKRKQQVPTIWDLQCIVGRIQHIRLWRPCVMCVSGPNSVERVVQTTQHCCALRFGDHGKREMLGVVCLRVWPLSNFVQQIPTIRNSVCKRTQLVTSNNVSPVRTGLKKLVQIP